MPVYLHHHSFAYLDRRSRLTGWLMRLAGPECVHIALSTGMASRLQAQYSVKQAVAVSNTVFFLQPDTTTEATTFAPRRKLHTLGLLSNLAEEKGVFLFLDLMAAARDAGLSLRGMLAGPFQDDETERRVRARLTHLPAVEYVGPKYGAEKDAFFASIDVFVFPTTYVNEAEPLVLHEAMQRGIPVIAYGRGAIPEIVGAESGLVVDPAVLFVPAALDCLRVWLHEPAVLEAASSAAVRRCVETYSASERRWLASRDALVDGVAMASPSEEQSRSTSSKV
ncbi:glycosyltransferase family 4 protein [Salinisphaera hydrothermalis]|nr:glycosyltransferase family 4 protein [Salinisphaera hydrothermalis]